MTTTTTKINLSLSYQKNVLNSNAYLYFKALIYRAIFTGIGDVLEDDAALLCWNNTTKHRQG